MAERQTAETTEGQLHDPVAKGSDHMGFKKIRVARGIRQDCYGFEAYVKVGAKQFAKRFPADATMGQMRLWRSQQKAADLAVKNCGRPIRYTPEFKALTEPLPRSENGWCYIYFLQDGDVVKIGKAVDPRLRRDTLQTGHSRPLVLILAVPGHASLEPAIHRKFAPLRVQNSEWFRMEPDLISFIERLQTGCNPVALLW